MLYTPEQTKAIHNYLHNYVKALEKTRQFLKGKYDEALQTRDRGAMADYKYELKSTHQSIKALSKAYEDLHYSGEPQFEIQTPLK